MHNVVSGSFDDLRAADALFLQAARQHGPLTALLWSDALAQRLTGSAPKFPFAERRYVLEAIRYIDAVEAVEQLASADALPQHVSTGGWVMGTHQINPARQEFCAAHGTACLPVDAPAGFPTWIPPAAPVPRTPGRKKVIVTGCYDWLHSGHVRFFEEASQYGDLYVVVGNDANVQLLKGTGHPLFAQEERRFFVEAIRYVTGAWITSGSGWMDAAPEIERTQPDIYLVNEDGDRPEKRAFCREHGLEYVVLQRTPKAGLPRRESTRLRGF